MRYYKFLTADMRSPIAGYVWPKVGEWTKRINTPLSFGQNGYHSCTSDGIYYWVNQVLCEIEYDGEVIVDGDVAVGSRARIIRILDQWDARMFSIECVKKGLKIYKRQRPNDDRLARCVAIFDAHSRGEATDDDLVVASKLALCAVADSAGLVKASHGAGWIARCAYHAAALPYAAVASACDAYIEAEWCVGPATKLVTSKQWIKDTLGHYINEGE